MTKHAMSLHRRGMLAVFTLLIATGLLGASPPAKTLTGKVVKIADGDTLTMLVGKTQAKVRLDGIDTPERAQPFGRKAGQARQEGVRQSHPGRRPRQGPVRADAGRRPTGQAEHQPGAGPGRLGLVVPEVRAEELGVGQGESSGSEGEAGSMGGPEHDPAVGVATEAAREGEAGSAGLSRRATNQRAGLKCLTTNGLGRQCAIGRVGIARRAGRPIPRHGAGDRPAGIITGCTTTAGCYDDKTPSEHTRRCDERFRLC